MQVDLMQIDEVLREAWKFRERAYAPYSRFPVGAAVLSASGVIHGGCNVENLSYGLTICAERNAVQAAVASGEREFRVLAIVAESGVPISPCGACRQVLAEFAPELRIVSENARGERFESTLAELLPRAKEGILL